MEIEVARPKPVAAIRRDRHHAGQPPIPVAEDLEGARFFGFVSGGIVAARDEDRQPVVQADPHLVPIDAGVDRLRLGDLIARRGVRVDPIDPQSARIAEGDEQMLGRDIGGHVDRPGRQRYRLTVRRQRA